jgi:hypothetical protein
MANETYDIVFNQNVSFSGPFGVLSAVVQSGSSLQVDYTGNTVTGVLHVELPNGTVVNLIGPFTLSGAPAGPFAITGPTPPAFGFLSISLNYNVPQPTSFGATINVGSQHISLTAEPSTNFLTSSPVVCFAPGTLVRTPRGDVPVESLQIGDLVLTASGALRPVKWMGHRDFDLRHRSRQFFPIRVAQDAFGPSRPSQDLFLSSGHSVCVDLCGEVFIPVGNLINGATVAQIEMDEVTYWHVELDSHESSSPTTYPPKAIWRWAIAASSRNGAAFFPPCWRDASGPTLISAVRSCSTGRFSPSCGSV